MQNKLAARTPSKQVMSSSTARPRYIAKPNGPIEPQPPGLVLPGWLFQKKQAIGIRGKWKPHLFRYVLFRSKVLLDWNIFTLLARNINHILHNWRRLSALTFMVCSAVRGYADLNTKCGNPPKPNKLPLHPWCLKNNHFRFWTFLGIFSRGNILPFQDTVNWPSVMRLCCQFLGFWFNLGQWNSMKTNQISAWQIHYIL